MHHLKVESLGNQVPYMTKALRKAIMKRSELETKYRKLRTKEAQLCYKKHKNYCSKLNKKEKEKILRQFRYKQCYR